MSTFITNVEPPVKLYQNPTSSFQVIGSFLVQKYENRSQDQKSRSDVAKIKLLRVHHNTYSFQVASSADP